MEEEKNPHVIHPSSAGASMTGHPTFHHPHAEAAQHEKPEAKKSAWTEKIFDMVITVSLVAMFFGLPIFFTGHTMQGIAFEKQVYFYFWVLLGLVAWASKGVITGELRIRRTPLDIPILLFVVFYGLDIAFSVDKWHSFFGFFGDPSRGFLAVLGLALAYFLLLSHFTWKRFLLMFGGFTVSGMLVVLWSMLAFEGVHFLPSAWNAFAPTSLIGTASTLATFLGLLVPSVSSSRSISSSSSDSGRSSRGRCFSAGWDSSSSSSSRRSSVPGTSGRGRRCSSSCSCSCSS